MGFIIWSRKDQQNTHHPLHSLNVQYHFYYSPMHTVSTCVEIQSLAGVLCIVKTAKLCSLAEGQWDFWDWTSPKGFGSYPSGLSARKPLCQARSCSLKSNKVHVGSRLCRMNGSNTLIFFFKPDLWFPVTVCLGTGRSDRYVTTSVRHALWPRLLKPSIYIYY